MDDEDQRRRRDRNVAIENLRHSDTIVLLDRADDADPWIALQAIRGLREYLEIAEQRAVVAALAEGGTWRRIGEALGCSHQRASSKHRADRSMSVRRHPSLGEDTPADPRMHVLEGGLDPDGIVLPDGRWVTHEDLTSDDRADLHANRTRLTSVPPAVGDEAAP